LYFAISRPEYSIIFEISAASKINYRLEGEMYKCEICQRIVPPGTKANRIPVETRFRRYPMRPKANHYIKEHKQVTSDDPGGVGHEIVREVLACPDCAEKLLRDSKQD
jgi:hypothetical protein